MLPTGALGARCAKYEPAIVRVNGAIFVGEDFGPPGYGEDPAHDSREEHLYIALDTPLCVVAGDSSGLNSAAQSNVKSMEMTYDLNRIRFQDGWLGRRAVVEGTLFHAFSGHHHTRVLIRVEAISVLNGVENSN